MPEIVEPERLDQINQEAEARKERRHRAAAMLRAWLAEDDGYDERVWPVVEKSLQSDFLAIGEPDEPCS